MGFTLKDLDGNFENAYVTPVKGDYQNKSYFLNYLTGKGNKAGKGKKGRLVLPALTNDWVMEVGVYHKNVKEIPNIMKSLSSEDILMGVYQGEKINGISRYNLVVCVVGDADHPYQAFSFTLLNDKPEDSYRHDAIEPDHYKNGDHDLLWHLKDILTPEEFRGAMKMNIIKYVVRENNKNGIEDIDKAKEYLSRFEEFEKWLNNENK